jgi:hypothetical protein
VAEEMTVEAAVAATVAVDWMTLDVAVTLVIAATDEAVVALVAADEGVEDLVVADAVVAALVVADEADAAHAAAVALAASTEVKPTMDHLDCSWRSTW